MARGQGEGQGDSKDDDIVDVASLNLGDDDEDDDVDDEEEPDEEEDEEPEQPLQARRKKGDESDEAPKVYTKAELDNAVSAGTITQDVADRVWEQQREEQIVNKAVERITTDAAKGAQGQTVRARIAAFKAAQPDVAKKGTAVRKQIEREFNRLVGELGMSAEGEDGLKTELLALQTVLGPVDKLKKGGRRTADTFEGGDSGSEDTERRGKNEDADEEKPSARLASVVPVNLTKRERNFYKQMIERGQYKDWNAVRAVMKNSNQGLRKRAEVAARGR